MTTPPTPFTRLRRFVRLIDGRYAALTRASWRRVVGRDATAGLVVAMTAIPMAMAFAMAMGLRPEQGIVAGALACAIGRTFGGSRYQIDGPTAAFIPIVAALMAKYGPAAGGSFAQAHGFLVLCSVAAGVVLVLCGLFGFGRFARHVPPALIVGFTCGIAVVIALSHARWALGLAGHGTGVISEVHAIASHVRSIHLAAVALALATFGITKALSRVSAFIPTPLIALAICTLAGTTVLADEGIMLVGDVYGEITTSFLVLTPPLLPEASANVVFDMVYVVVAIVFVSGVQSVMCSSMADRLANAPRAELDPDRNVWGQGVVQIVTPLFNGMPCSGALAPTATSIKAGAVTPLAGYFNAIFTMAMAFVLAPQLERVPLACIAGILLWVASNMVKPAEIREVARHGWFHTAVMVFTAVMVPMTDFLTGVLSALVLYVVLRRICEKAPSPACEPALAR